ncbi:hypothetical protein [Sphingobacterium ginsenosidimutans]|uniref:Signal transduction histidine kinase internal region domain-containing protein n=1 Tax=Sphingobacterium ginsenosidimutans TaxID=687845 RepID=A0ABP7ZW06_9SPHI
MMTKGNILKPLPYRIHAICWTIYFIWISTVNVYKYGWGHLPVMFPLGLVMLIISYLNRVWLRRMLFRRFSTGAIFTLLSYFLLTALAVFLLLYQFPTELSRRILKNPQLFRSVDFVIDVLTFYISFALKGLIIVAIEVGYNLTLGLFRHLGLLRGQSAESRKTQLFRDWTVHFMGNLTQSFTRLARKRSAALIRIDLFFGIQAYAMRKLNFGNSMLGKLEDELFYLQQLMRLYDERGIELITDIRELNKQIIPIMLLSLYKNMIKHGDFSDLSQLGIIRVFSDTDKVLISCRNKVAVESAWIFEDGGTGLEKLMQLLRLEYGEAFSLIQKTNEGIFYLNLEINF